MTRRASGVFAHSRWDLIPCLMGLAHFAFVATLYFSFGKLPWLLWLAMALLYAISISWSINSTCHNLIHNPFFRWSALNRAFSLLLSVTNGFSQELYRHVHLRHHVGNSDRVDAKGTTIDPLSIYRHGHDGKAESVWTYTFLSYFRDDASEVYARVKQRHPEQIPWIRLEIIVTVLVYLAMLIGHWQALLAMLPFYYLGQSLSSLNGYYEHFNGDPDTPIAWGVSTYSRLYNWTWLYNGYHAEHHYRPKQHWTRMVELRDSIADQQRRAGVHVIAPCHALGFLDRREPPARPTRNPAAG